MTEAIGFILNSAAFLAVAAVVIPRYRPRERSWLWGAVALHLFATVALVAFTRHIFRGGDMLYYHRLGAQLVALMQTNFETIAPQVNRLLLQQDARLPFVIPGAGDSTGSMVAVSAWLQYLLGPSLYGLCTMVTAVGFFCRLLLYRVLRERLPEAYHHVCLLSCLYVPSVVFWTAGLLKEPIAMIGMCLAIWAAHELATRGPRLLALLALPLGMAVAALIKAYILLPLGVAGAVWYYVHRASGGTGRMRRLRPVQLAVAVALAVAIVFGIGELFPRYQIDRFAEQAVQQQTLGQQYAGGSTYSLGGGGDDGPTGVFALGPVALLTALFRPQLFDVRSPVVLVSAAEMTLLTWLAWLVWRRRGVRGSLRMLTRSHTLLFCALFVIGFGTGVGLTTTNFGTLARYRVPMMPMYALLLLVLSGVGRTATRAKAARPSPATEATERAAMPRPTRRSPRGSDG